MRGHQRADELSTCLIVVALTDVFRGILSYSLINIDASRRLASENKKEKTTPREQRDV